MKPDISDARALALKAASDAIKRLVGLGSTDEIGWTIKFEELLCGLKVKNVEAFAAVINELDAVNSLKRENAKLRLEKEELDLVIAMEVETGAARDAACRRYGEVTEELKKFAR